MTKEQKIWIASKFAEKGYGYETLFYSDNLLGLEVMERCVVAEEIWEYMEEYKEYGSIAFKEKYKSSADN